MKDRAIRRHQDLLARDKSRKIYNSCVGDFLSPDQKHQLEANIEKYKKVCSQSHTGRRKSKAFGKSLQERRHNITMKEQLRLH